MWWSRSDDSAWPASLMQVLERHYGELRLFARRRTGSEAAADDIIHDIWVKLANLSANETRPATHAANPKAYLKRMIANLVIDRQRQATARSRHMSDGGLPAELPSQEASAFDVVAGQQELRLVQEAISELPEKCRHVFLLYRGGTMTMKEVAAQLGISPKTVENHIAHALSELRKRLAAARKGH